MIVKSDNRLVEGPIKCSLLRGSEDGKGTATSRRMSSLECGGSEYFHGELKKQKRKHTAYIPSEMVKAGLKNN